MLRLSVYSFLVLVSVTLAVEGYLCRIGTFKTRFCESSLVFLGEVQELVQRSNNDAIYRVKINKVYKQPDDAQLQKSAEYKLVVENEGIWHEGFETERPYLFGGVLTNDRIYTSYCGITEFFGSKAFDGLEEYQRNMLLKSSDGDNVCDGCTIVRRGKQVEDPTEVCRWERQSLWRQDCFRDSTTGQCVWV